MPLHLGPFLYHRATTTAGIPTRRRVRHAAQNQAYITSVHDLHNAHNPPLRRLHVIVEPSILSLERTSPPDTPQQSHTLCITHRGMGILCRQSGEDTAATILSNNFSSNPSSTTLRPWARYDRHSSTDIEWDNGSPFVGGNHFKRLVAILRKSCA